MFRSSIARVVFGCSLIFGGAAKPCFASDQPAAARNDRVESLFETMRAGKYAEMSFPKLEVSDVPALLQHVDSTKSLKSFPRNSLSSQYEAQCSEGMVALWLIEGVHLGGKFPSNNALCFKRGLELKNWTEDSEKNHAALVKVYRDWWDRVRTQKPEPTKDDSPLKDTLYAWH